MSEKKRKAASSSSASERPKKRQQTTQAISIEHVQSGGGGPLVPIIATTPGTSFPRNVKFQAYSKKTSHAGDTNLLIHTSDHPTIDYTATEGTESASAHQKHYIGIYDPSTNNLQLTEAKSLTVRSSVRQQRRLDSSDDEDGETATATAAPPPPSSQGTRAALTEAFGSKKSKKAVQSMAENRQFGQGGQGATIAEALIAGISSGEDEEPTDLQKAVAAAALTNKPLPRPNLTTSDIEQVYSLSSLIVPQPASTTLKLMPIGLWTGRLKANKEITNLRSRFVANRISYIGRHALSISTDNADSDTNTHSYTQHLQVLRYIALLIELSQFCAKFTSRSSRLPYVEKWPDNTISNAANIPSHIPKEIMKHFFPNNAASQHSLTLLHTTILALALHIPPPSGRTEPNTLVAEPTDIQLDLALDVAGTRKLFHELGCKVASAKEKELMVWGYHRILEKSKRKKERDADGGDGSGAVAAVVQAPRPMFAVLKFPLEFPKVSTGRRMRPGGRR